MAKQTPEEIALEKSLKDASKGFKKLTEDAASVSMSLAKNAAEQKKSTAETFEGFLQSRKITKHQEKLSNDLDLMAANATLDMHTKQREKLQDILDDSVKQQEDAIKNDVGLTNKREELEALRMNLDTDIFTSKKAEKAAQEKANGLQRQINSDTIDLKAMYATEIDSATNDLKTNADELKEVRDDVLEREKEYSKDLENIKDGSSFSAFSGALKELTGGFIDMDSTLGTIMKKFGAMGTLLHAMGSFAETLMGLQFVFAAVSFKDLLKKMAEMFPRIASFFTSIAKGFSFIAKGIGKIFTGIGTIFSTVFGSLVKFGAFIFNGARNLFLGAASMLSAGLTTVVGWMGTAMNGLRAAGVFLKTGIASMATGFLNIGKNLLKGAKRLLLSSATLVAGMLATAMSALIAGISFLMPAILIGLAIAAVIFGVMYLAKKLEENKDMIMFKWGLIQESFSIAIAGLILWKDKAVTFIGNVFKDIWMSIKSLFSAVMTGIENGINFAIQGINSFLPDRFKIDEVDIGAKAMATGLDEEKAALAITREKEQEEFSARGDELEERKATVIENFKLDEVPKDGVPLSLENAQSVNAKSGEDISNATTEVNEGAKKGAGNVSNITGINSDNSTAIAMSTTIQTGSPRDTDGTVGRVNMATA